MGDEETGGRREITSPARIFKLKRILLFVNAKKAMEVGGAAWQYILWSNRT
jgi:hypothetical protein